MSIQISFRAATLDDFGYCARLYFAGRERTIQESNLDMAALFDDLRGRWEVGEVRITTVDDTDVGWLQCSVQEDAVFIVQLFIEGPVQGRGIGTQVMHRVIDEAGVRGRAVTLGVVKTNPAMRLYERLGFRVTHEDERKFYMRRVPS